MSRVLIAPEDLERAARALDHSAAEVREVAARLAGGGAALPEGLVSPVRDARAGVAAALRPEAEQLEDLAVQLRGVAAAARQAAAAGSSWWAPDGRDVHVPPPPPPLPWDVPGPQEPGPEAGLPPERRPAPEPESEPEPGPAPGGPVPVPVPVPEGPGLAFDPRPPGAGAGAAVSGDRASGALGLLAAVAVALALRSGTSTPGAGDASRPLWQDVDEVARHLPARLGARRADRPGSTKPQAAEKRTATRGRRRKLDGGRR